jgi:hypothetical protein
VMVTEHYPPPSANFVPNKDKPHGADTRVYDNSAVCLDQPPFNVRDARLILEVDVATTTQVADGGKLRTFVLTH